MKLLHLLFIKLLVLMLVASCSTTIKYSASSVKVKPLKTKARTIILHEDFVFSSETSKELKRLALDQLISGLQKNSKYQLKVLKSGEVIPQNDSNKSQIMLVANLWFHKGQTNGSDVIKVRRYDNGLTYQKSWDVIENTFWEQEERQSMISLYFIEIGRETQLLRATITTSSDKKKLTKASNRSPSINQQSGFFQVKNMQAGYDLISANADLGAQHQYLPELIQKSIQQHLQNL